jgi:hypothetical protein
MLNEHTFIEKGTEKIACGVENWGITLKKQAILIKLPKG